MYSEKVMEHFKNPRNQGKIEGADAVGEAGNPACGDVMQLYLKIGENKQHQKIIEDIKFETLGCVAAIATSSILTEMVKGKTLEQALEISNEDIMKELEGLPAPKEHCSLLAVSAFREAVYQYFKKQGREISDELEKAHQKNLRFCKIAEERKKQLSQEFNEAEE